MNIPLVGPAYTERSPDLNAQTCVNLYPVSGGPNSRTPGALYTPPGLKPLMTVGVNTIDAIYREPFGTGRMLVAADGELWQVTNLEVATQIGTINADPRPSFASVPNTLAASGSTMLVSGGTLYYIEGGTVTDISGLPGVPALIFSVAALNGRYFLADNGSAGRFVWSNAYPAVAPTFDALDFATAEAVPDILERIAAHDGNLWLMGRDSTEVWYPTGGVLPVSPIGGATVRRGITSFHKGTVARVGESLMWVSTDGDGRIQVVRTEGLTVVPVSTPAIDLELIARKNVFTLRGYSMHHDGRDFYTLHAGGHPNLVYELATGMWHVQGQYNAIAGVYLAPPAALGISQFGANKRDIVMTGTSNELLEVDPATHDFNGASMRRERVMPVVHADGKRIFASELEIFAETGVGDANTPSPTLALDWSDDGGRTWSTARTASLGAAGETTTRIRFHRLGSFRRRNFRLSVTDPVKVVLMGAELTYTVGT